jgi:hypothetical protein
MNKLWGLYATSVNDLENFKTTTEYVFLLEYILPG